LKINLLRFKQLLTIRCGWIFC